jgi:hypothetical protein
MSWIHRALPFALLAILPGCPADDGEDTTVGESGPSNDTSATASASATVATTADATADATASPASSDDSSMLGCAADIAFDTTNGASDPVMETWGAACTTNEDCVALIGDPAAICDTMAVVYELPGGYCTKECALPDAETRAVFDAPDCDPAGGVACIGVMGTFERCGIVCTDDMQCNRGGYECRQMPLVSLPEDPSLCLMPDCCEGTCDD